MKSQKARDFVKTMEVDYNAKNKMINSTGLIKLFEWLRWI